MHYRADYQSRLAAMGARLIVQALAQLPTLTATPQPEAAATYARKIDKAEAMIDWSQAAQAIARRVRAFDPVPGAATLLAGHLRLAESVPFLIDRLKVQQREAGVRHDLIDAVFALGGEDDLVRLLARVKALQAFVTTDEGGNLLAGYKRAANILKQAGDDKNSRHPELVSGSIAPLKLRSCCTMDAETSSA